MVALKVNGTAHNLDLEPEMPLLWALRNEIGLTGTKYGCGIAQCGACTVLMDGMAVRSCQVALSRVQGKEITTIEGLSADGSRNKVQAAWIAEDVPQCGYCQSGQIMSAMALLNRTPNPAMPTSTRHGRQYLPLRHLCPHPPRHPARGRRKA